LFDVPPPHWSVTIAMSCCPFSTKFTAAFKPLDAMMEKELAEDGAKVTKSYLQYKKLPKTKMINFEFEFERPDDIDDFIDDFQEEFEDSFIAKEYLIAGYHNFMEANDDAPKTLENYDAFWTYSLCHLEYSYNMFDKKGAHPEAGLFAPCSMYMYYNLLLSLASSVQCFVIWGEVYQRTCSYSRAMLPELCRL
jgi:hypothetical protein